VRGEVPLPTFCIHVVRAFQPEIRTAMSRVSNVTCQWCFVNHRDHRGKTVALRQPVCVCGAGGGGFRGDCPPHPRPLSPVPGARGGICVLSCSARHAFIAPNTPVSRSAIVRENPCSSVAKKSIRGEHRPWPGHHTKLHVSVCGLSSTALFSAAVLHFRPVAATVPDPEAGRRRPEVGTCRHSGWPD